MPATSSPSAGRPDTVAAMPGRFSISVPDRRGPSDPWFSIGTLDVTTTVFVVILGVASMFMWALEGPQHQRVRGAVPARPDKVLDGQVWRIATWPQANDLSQGQAIWFVVTLAILWYFGSALEGLLGRNQFAVFLALIVVIPGIVGALINLPQAGLRPVELCVFLVFVAEYPFARFFFNIPAWVFGAVILGIEVIQLLGDRNERGIIFLFTSLAVAAVTARTMGLLHELPWIPALPIGNRRSPRRRTQALARQLEQRRRRGGRRAVDHDRADRPGAHAAVAPPAPGSPALVDERSGRARRPARQDLGGRHGRPRRRREAPPQRALQADAQPQVGSLAHDQITDETHTRCA